MEFYSQLNCNILKICHFGLLIASKYARSQYLQFGITFYVRTAVDLQYTHFLLDSLFLHNIYPNYSEVKMMLQMKACMNRLIIK